MYRVRRAGGLLGAKGVANDGCLYGETYAMRTIRRDYSTSARAQQAVQYYLGGGPALSGSDVLLRVFGVNTTALQAYQRDPEVLTAVAWHYGHKMQGIKGGKESLIHWRRPVAKRSRTWVFLPSSRF